MNLIQLQISEYGSNGLNPFIFYGCIVIAFFIAVFITRAIFSIPTLIRHNKMQTLLLVKIARAKGVTEEEIKIITNILDEDPNNIIGDGLMLQDIDKLHIKE